MIPVVEYLHFFDFVVDFSQACPDFFINIHYYNSLRRSTKAGTQLDSDSSEIVAEVNEFLCNFVLHKPEHKNLKRAHHEKIDKLQYQECPQQINGIDCGLFDVGVVLHILVGETIDSDTFSQEHVTELSLKLGDNFMGAKHNRMNKQTINSTAKLFEIVFRVCEEQ
jgi:Ulp1 family protease